MDRKGLRSTMNRWTGAAGSSPKEEHAGVPMYRTSPWRRGEQEEGTWISTLVGTRRRRGSDGWAMVDQGGSRSSSTRGRSRCGGEERWGAAGVVWRGRDGGTFSRGGEGRRLVKRWPEVHYQGTGYSKGRRRGSDDSWGN
jgi:hypothetical protein